MRSKVTSRPVFWLGLVIIYSFLSACYYVVRYAGHWSDVDTTSLTLAIRTMGDEGTIFPQSFSYSTGYVYQAVAVFLADVSGLSVITLQTAVLPLAAAVLGSVVIFMLFREYLGRPAYAAFATLLLYVHPEYIFVILRGSHEKLTWPLAALSIYLLLISYRAGQSQRRQVVNIVLFYLCIYTFIAINFFFASSFVLALLTSAALGLLWSWLRPKGSLPEIFQPLFRRYLYIIASTLVLLVIVMFYTYPPASSVLQTMKNIGEKIAALFLSYQGTKSSLYDAYGIINYGWISREIYFFLTIINYVIAALSFVTFLTLVFRPRYLTRERMVLVLFYVAFTIQIVAGVVADLSGSLGGNLQLRVMPAWLLAAIPLSVTGLNLFFGSRVARGYKLAAGALVPLFLVMFSLNSLIKATNEPLVSNYWQFYSGAEVTGLRWTNQHLYHSTVWLDYDGVRLQALWSDLFFGDSRDNESDGAIPRFQTRSFFISDITRRWSSRQEQPLPMPSDSLQVYDNGQAQLYHLRPQSPFQH